MMGGAARMAKNNYTRQPPPGERPGPRRNAQARWRRQGGAAAATAAYSETQADGLIKKCDYEFQRDNRFAHAQQEPQHTDRFRGVLGRVHAHCAHRRGQRAEGIAAEQLRRVCHKLGHGVGTAHVEGIPWAAQRAQLEHGLPRRGAPGQAGAAARQGGLSTASTPPHATCRA